MSIRRLLLFIAILLLTVPGCGAGSGDGPFGAPAKSRLLSPFSGSWAFEFDATLEALKAAGTSTEDIEKLRKLYASNSLPGKMHPDITVNGNQILCAGFRPGEYWLFGLHEHDGVVCGKAWHHEDRFDPGDMSKCYVRLRIKDDRLHFTMRMKEGLDTDDPDLRSTPPTELESSTRCDADSPTGEDWSEWSTYVFSRKR